LGRLGDPAFTDLVLQVLAHRQLGNHQGWQTGVQTGKLEESLEHLVL
jgi:hypothetical protein